MTRPIWEQRIRDGGCSASVAETRDLLDEIDRLRSLPVLATCGDCGHLERAEPRQHCEHPGLGRRTVAARHMTATDAAPPTWCPLRRGGR